MKFQTVSTDKRELKIDWEKVNIYASRYKPGTPFDVEIVRRQKKKSDPMRKFYFGAVLPPFMKELGYEPDDELQFHMMLKITYFKGTHDIHQDERGIWKNIPSVFSNESELDVPVKKEFVEWVIRKAAHYGVYIDDPE